MSLKEVTAGGCSAKCEKYSPWPSCGLVILIVSALFAASPAKADSYNIEQLGAPDFSRAFTQVFGAGGDSFTNLEFIVLPLTGSTQLAGFERLTRHGPGCCWIRQSFAYAPIVKRFREWSKCGQLLMGSAYGTHLVSLIPGF
jgi:hypothetical protein